MTRRILFIVLFLLMGVFAVAMGANAESNGWESVGEGIEYREFLLPDPNKVYVARMDLSNPNAIIESSIAQGKLVDGLETVSSQANRYDQALNWWGSPSIPHSDGAWGARNQVVVAINGTFTLPPDYEQQWEGQVHSGWYMWRFQDSATRNAFVWKLDRTTFIGDCVTHPSSKQLVYYQTGSTQEIAGVNVQREDDQLILYTPQYDRDTNTDNSGVEVLVELTRPTLIVYPERVNGYAREIRNSQGSTPIPFDHIVLSASGQAATRLKNNVSVGDQIGISQLIKNCDSESTLDWSKTYASVVSNDFYFLKDGVYVYNDDYGANVRNPRTAVAYNEQYVYFIVVDGRYKDVSIGMTMEQIAEFARVELDADHGLSLDGGGSSTMVVNGQVVNFPSDGIPLSDALDPAARLGARYVFGLRGVPRSERYSNAVPQVYLPMLQREYDNPGVEPDPTATPAPTPTPTPLPIVERSVPNGLMMVLVLPRESSSSFLHGEQVRINSYGNVNVRLGPGTNYGVINVVPNGTSGIILDHMNGLNGVNARGYYWWKVKLSDIEGWVAESLLVKNNP